MMNILRQILTLLIYSVLVLPVIVCSEEQNVRPGINQYYQNPDFDRWVSVFENPGREIYEQRHTIVDALDLTSGMNVADIGSGTGFFTIMFAQRVGPDGIVYAVDIAEEFVQNTLRRANENGLSNVQGVINEPKDVNLPDNSIDLAFICDTYHHFEYPKSTMQSVYRALKPGGSVVVIDFKKIPGFSSSWVMGHVRLEQQSVISEIESQGFNFVKAEPLLSRNYFLRFVKK